MRYSIRTLAAGVAVLLLGTGVASANTADTGSGRTSLTPATTPPRPASLPGNAVGIATGYEPLYYDDTKLARYLDALRGVGVQYVRTDINLRQVFEDPTNATNGMNSPNWLTADRYVAAVNARGLAVLWILTNTPAWAAAPGYSGVWAPWADDALFGEAARKVVARYYDRGVTTYEIWNEPNYSWFFGDIHDRKYTDADVAKFGGMLRAAYRAMKDQAPGATVIGPGLGQAGTYQQVGGNGWMNEQRYLEKLYDPLIGNAKGHLDALSIHPYGDFYWGTDGNRYYDYAGAADDWVGWNKMYETKPSIRSIMVANGEGHKKIWATEIGAPAKRDADGAWSAGTGTTEAVQAAITAQVVQRWSALPFAGGLAWYAGIDSSSALVEGDRWGLLRSDWSPKPSYAALRDALRAASGRGTGGGGGPAPDAPPALGGTGLVAAPVQAEAPSGSRSGGRALLRRKLRARVLQVLRQRPRVRPRHR
jgi:polysaccharide biosynthesis protein PslG